MTEPGPVGWLDVDGDIRPAPPEAHPRALVLSAGRGLYETLRTYGGIPHLLDRHLARLREGAAVMGLTVPVGDATIEGRVEALLARRADSAESTVRLLLAAPGSLTVAVAPFDPQPRERYEVGVAAIVSERVRRDQNARLAGVKAIEIARLSHTAREEATRAGAYEGLVPNLAGRLAEGAYSNLLWIECPSGKAVLMAVDPTEGPLEGVTQGRVLELAARLGLPVERATCPLERLLAADEAMLTSSLGELLPLVRVEGRPVGDAAPGPWSGRLLQAYRRDAAEGG